MLAFVGYLAGLFGAVSLLPEVSKALKTHHLKDVAWGMLGLTAFSSFLWFLYGYHLESYPVMLSDGLHFSMACLLIGLKIHYHKGGKTLVRQTETEKSGS